MPAFPYIPVPDAPRALAFYETAFGAEVFHKVLGDGGRIVHARFRIEDAVVMLYEYAPGELPGIVTPVEAGVTTATVRVVLETKDAVDRVFACSEQNGATINAAPENVPWNEYYGRMTDPFGHAWAFGAPVCVQGEQNG